MQPTRFQVVNLDPPSQMLYNSLNSKHMSGETVTAMLNSAGQDLTSNVQGKFVSLKVSALLFDLGSLFTEHSQVGVVVSF